MSKNEKFSRLDPDQLKTAIPGAVIGREIIVLEQTSSTNDAISRLASTNGLPSIQEGLIVFAEHQTAGRGQRGNRWESIAGKGLWFSILLRPGIEVSDSGRLTVWAIEAISAVIRRELDLTPVLKLPNDVRVNGQKVAGVLVEMRAQNNAPHLAVVGIGINVNQRRQDFPDELRERAISLAIALGRQVDRQQFATALLRHLDASYRQQFLGNGTGEECDDPDPEIEYTTLPRSAPAATTSPAPTTIPDRHAEKSRMA
jgi:BirA family transcriptional regulator, biotin operon repressor / biotin---[acetyl-CoA-carboxylase] ligase